MRLAGCLLALLLLAAPLQTLNSWQLSGLVRFVGVEPGLVVLVVDSPETPGHIPLACRGRLLGLCASLEVGDLFVAAGRVEATQDGAVLLIVQKIQRLNRKEGHR